MHPSIGPREPFDVSFERLILFFLLFPVLKFLIKLGRVVKEGV